jgi:hypothetical protein
MLPFYAVVLYGGQQHACFCSDFLAGNLARSCSLQPNKCSHRQISKLIKIGRIASNNTIGTKYIIATATTSNSSEKMANERRRDN